MAYRLNQHAPFHLPEALAGSDHQPPLPSPDYYSYLIQTPDGSNVAGAAGSTPGPHQQQQQQQASGSGGDRLGAKGWTTDGRGGWDPSMFRPPLSGAGNPQLPSFMRAPSLGDISRSSQAADTHRAVDEWNLASYHAGAAGVRFDAGDGVNDWGWGDQPLGSPSVPHETQESFRAAAAILGGGYDGHDGRHDFTLVPSPALSSAGPHAHLLPGLAPTTRSSSDPTPPSATSRSTPNQQPHGSAPDSGRSSNGPPTSTDQPHQHEQPAPPPLVAGAFPPVPSTATAFPGVGRRMPGLYSSSGFDVLGVLSRVITHPSARQLLGPVDLSCSFIVVDVRKADLPIAYASPSFSALTGYENKDIVGKNCRFLQAPDGVVKKGTRRQYTDNVAVTHLHDRFTKRKECQASLINYKRGGSPFLNLVTIVPIAKWDSDEIEFLVGFQVDLVEAPNAILASMQDGTYQVSYQTLQSVARPLPPPGRAIAARGARRRRELTAGMRAVVEGSGRESAAAVLRKLDRDAVDKADKTVMAEWYKSLAEHTDDFVHVLSLKGQFQYVSPFVRSVLGYEPEDLQGKHITDICHPADAVSVVRELKESTQAAPYGRAVKTVSYLCRLERKVGGHAWIECTGRLHVEPGKGRKVVILTGRERVLPRLDWSAIGAAGGLGAGGQDEGWGMASAEGLILYASAELQDILGARSADALLGDSLLEHVPAPLGASPLDRNATTLSPSQLRPTAEQTARQKITDALSLAGRGLPKNASVTVRHQILLPTAGRSYSGASSSSVPPPAPGRTSSDPTMLLHEVATTFYAVHADAPWPDPCAAATPDADGAGASDKPASRSPIGSPATDSFPLEERQGPSQRRSKPPPIIFQVKVIRPLSDGDPAAALQPAQGRQPLAPAGTDVFKEIGVGRETSWLYESQQLKATNRRLRKQVAAARASRPGTVSTQKDDGGKRKRSPADSRAPPPPSALANQQAYPPPAGQKTPAVSNYQPQYAAVAPPPAPVDPRQAYQQSLYRAQSSQFSGGQRAPAPPQAASSHAGAHGQAYPNRGQQPSFNGGSYSHSSGASAANPHAPFAAPQPSRRY